MKKLTIIRHGKAQSRDPASIPDEERKLEERGRKDALRVGSFYAGMAPDLIVSSPAVRALETAELFAKGADYSGDIEQDECIYHDNISGSVDELLAFIRKQETDHLAIVGHNPQISDLVPFLDGIDGRSIVEDLYLVTAASAHIVFKDLDKWQDLQPNSGQLRAMVSPRFLKDFSG